MRKRPMLGSGSVGGDNGAATCTARGLETARMRRLMARKCSLLRHAGQGRVRSQTREVDTDVEGWSGGCRRSARTLLGEGRVEMGDGYKPLAQARGYLTAVIVSLMELHLVVNAAHQIRRFASHPDEVLAPLRGPGRRRV
jgi:hypothetical protein